MINPAQRKALEAAALWHARLSAHENSNDTAAFEDQLALSAWLDKDPLHTWAWGRLAQLQQRLGEIRATTPGDLVMATFDRAERASGIHRRSLLKGVAALAGTGVLSYGAVQQPIAQHWLADQRTGTGQTKQIALSDGSKLVLNTASGVDVKFNNRERRLRLQQGEVMIEAVADATRPFILETAQGLVQTDTARFSARDMGEQSRVTVFENRVEVICNTGRQRSCTVGESVEFAEDQLIPGSFIPHSDAWVRQLLVVQDMPLDAFIAELNRYRTGVLRADPAVSRFRISGAFKLDNTDQALAAIAKSFPIQIVYRSRYWVTIS